jgi:replication-associated recombination protein RarA
LDAIRRTEGSFIGSAFLIVGCSGLGKSTLAKLICAEACEDSCVTVIGGRKLKTEELDDIFERFQGRPLFGNGWGVIVEEAHQLHGHIIDDLKVVLEDQAVQRTSVWCFTSTPAELQSKSLFGGEEAAAGLPFLSRCHVLHLDCGEQATLDFALRLKAIATAESLDGKSVTEYVRMVRDNRWNLRACLQKISEGEMRAS